MSKIITFRQLAESKVGRHHGKMTRSAKDLQHKGAPASNAEYDGQLGRCPLEFCEFAEIHEARIPRCPWSSDVREADCLLAFAVVSR